MPIQDTVLFHLAKNRPLITVVSRFPFTPAAKDRNPETKASISLACNYVHFASYSLKYRVPNESDESLFCLFLAVLQLFLILPDC